MADVNLDDARRSSLRLAAIGALAFSVLFVIHHVLQGTAPTAKPRAAASADNGAPMADRRSLPSGTARGTDDLLGHPQGLPLLESMRNHGVT